MIQDIAPHRYDVTYRKDNADPSDIMLIYSDNSLFCRYEETSDAKTGTPVINVTFPTVGEISEFLPFAAEKAKFLFRIDDRNYFELRNISVKPFDNWDYISKGKFRSIRPLWHAFAVITGFQIHSWYDNTKYCGKCGSPMEPHGRERAMVCPSCGRVCYPQICPSVIVGVTNGDKLLMTKYAAGHSTYRNYALIAGYAEIGESLEDTVRREVMEEVGLKVKNIRYYKSQPWSYTDTLLVGYFCDVDGDDTIDMDQNELSVAEWLTRDSIPEESANSSISLTGDMMKAFKDGNIR